MKIIRSRFRPRLLRLVLGNKVFVLVGLLAFIAAGVLFFVVQQSNSITAVKVRLTSVSISPSGDRIAMAVAIHHSDWQTARVFVHNLSDGSYKLLPAIEGWNLHDPSFSHDGRMLVATAQPSIRTPKELILLSEQVRLVSIEIGKTDWQILIQRKGTISDPRFTSDDRSIVFKSSDLKEVLGKIRSRNQEIRMYSIDSGEQTVEFRSQLPYSDLSRPVFTDAHIIFTALFRVNSVHHNVKNVRRVVGNKEQFPVLPFRIPLKGSFDPKLSVGGAEFYKALYQGAGQVTNLTSNLAGTRFVYSYFTELEEQTGTREGYGRHDLRVWQDQKVKIVSEKLKYIWEIDTTPNGNQSVVLGGSWNQEESEVFLVNIDSGQIRVVEIKKQLESWIEDRRVIKEMRK